MAVVGPRADVVLTAGSVDEAIAAAEASTGTIVPPRSAPRPAREAAAEDLGPLEVAERQDVMLADLERMAGMPVERSSSNPTQAPTASEQSRPAPGQRSEPAQTDTARDGAAPIDQSALLEAAESLSAIWFFKAKARARRSNRSRPGRSSFCHVGVSR